MKIITIFFTMILITSIAQAEDLAQSWQGEWGKWEDEDNGGGISVQNCGEDLKCELRFKSGKPESTARCEGSAALTIKSELEAEAVLLNYDKKPDNCRLKLKKNADEILLFPEGDACPRYCTTEGKYQEKYKKRTNKNYFYLNSEICFFDDRPAVELLCTDKEVFATHEDWKKNEEELFNFEKAKNYAEYNKLVKDFKTALLEKCNADESVKRCIIEGFNLRTAELKKLIDAKSSEQSDFDKKFNMAGKPEEARKIISQIAGVYKHKFQNAMVSGEGYESEDVFEIAPFNNIAFYFRAHLYFYNGHECDVWGIAEYRQSGDFVFESKTEEGLGKCQLVFKHTAKEVGFNTYTSPLSKEDSSCQIYCGARGSLHDIKFPAKNRRTIKYMDRLKKSEEFGQAVEEYKTVRP
jgi:hypothetical protein